MGLPKLGKFPVDTKGRAANAKARAAQGLRKGEISETDAKKVMGKADKVLGGSAKKKAARKSPAKIVKAAKAAKGGKLPKLKPVAKKPNPAKASKKSGKKKR